MSSLLWCVHLLSETGQLKVKAPADMPSVAVHPPDNKMETGMEGFLSPQDDLLCIWQGPKQDISSTFSGNARIMLESMMGHDKPFSRQGTHKKTRTKRSKQVLRKRRVIIYQAEPRDAIGVTYRPGVRI